MKTLTEPVYSHDFYTNKAKRTAKLNSARVLVPIVLDLLHPRSVIDIGCGTGLWLSVFQAHGITDVSGVDGHWIESIETLIPKSQLLIHNLAEPLRLDRTFDLAVSLEVAEHLPPASAETFIETLTQAAPVIWFSAAIPLQGGTNHVNEQWPEYWAKRFQQKGFVPIDAIRPRVWSRSDVLHWYIQNSLLYVRQDVLDANPVLKQEAERTSGYPLNVVHPTKYLETATRLDQYTHLTMKDVLKAGWRRMRKGLRRIIR